MQICDALAEAHAAGFVHRDVKPANILLQWPDGAVDGRSVTAKLADFGLAKPLGSQTRPPITLQAMPVGTPGYMPPEQFEDPAHVDARVDVFALGAVIYHMTTRVMPFAGDNIAQVMSVTLTQEPKPPHELVEAFDEQLESIIMACLRKDREERFESIQKLRESLRACLEDRPLSGCYELPANMADVKRSTGSNSVFHAVKSAPRSAELPVANRSRVWLAAVGLIAVSLGTVLATRTSIGQQVQSAAREWIDPSLGPTPDTELAVEQRSTLVGLPALSWQAKIGQALAVPAVDSEDEEAGAARPNLSRRSPGQVDPTPVAPTSGGGSSAADAEKESIWEEPAPAPEDVSAPVEDLSTQEVPTEPQGGRP